MLTNEMENTVDELIAWGLGLGPREMWTSKLTFFYINLAYSCDFINFLFSPMRDILPNSRN